MPRLLHKFCDDSEMYLTVEVGLITVGGLAAIWDVSVWDASLWGFSEAWLDVSDYVLSVKTSRKFDRGLRIWSTGAATVELNNADGRFSPDNLSGPYVAAGVTSIQPGCNIRVSLTYEGIVYWLFTGKVDQWAEDWQSIYGPRTGGATTVISASDMWSRIAQASIASVTPAVGSGELFGARIHRILDAAGITVPRNFDTGTVAMQGTLLDGSPDQLIALACDSENGAVYLESDGTILAKRKYALTEDPRSITPQATFGDGGLALGEIPWETISVAGLNLDGVVNSAIYTMVGGTQQIYRDYDSIARFGILGDKTPNIDSLICGTDPEVLSLAQWAVITQKDPMARVEGLTVPILEMLPSPFNVIHKLLGLRARDLVEIVRRPPSSWAHTMTRSCFVNGIDFTISQGKVYLGLGFYPAEKLRDFSLSRWDVAVWDSSPWFV